MHDPWSQGRCRHSHKYVWGCSWWLEAKEAGEALALGKEDAKVSCFGKKEVLVGMANVARNRIGAEAGAW